ncbi:MAG: hypothetical protein JO145_06845 [Acidobacteriaceae bacterium]|nr:hypothetical protein [Acidobacteriaceae bacterium]
MIRAFGCLLALVPALYAAQNPSGAEIAASVEQMSLDPQQTYRVRELNIARGDIKIYLSEGVLSFVTPVGGRSVAAVFTTQGVEAGDAEILVLPPQRSERASLAAFAKTPNLDEHFSTAIFLFSDETAKELLAQINERPVHKSAETAGEIGSIFNPVLRSVTSQIEVRLVQTLLDNHDPAQGFFYGLIAGREAGTFDVMYEPTDFEPVSMGRVATLNDGQQKFQLWTSFRPRRAPPFVRAPSGLSDYQIDTAIRPDLSLSATARLSVIPKKEDGRILPFDLSERLGVRSATIDGKPVEVFQHASVRFSDLKTSGTFLLVSDVPLTPGRQYSVEIRYEGSVIHQTGEGSYFVDERNAWYPYRSPMLTNFDLTFRCPNRLRLVSTGELISDQIEGGVRIVHRRTRVPEPLAGFNLGDYDFAEEHGQYRVECYANKARIAVSNELDEGLEEISKDTGRILDYYTRLWSPLPIRSVAVSPVPGYFGQGFPGLIYLSSISYMRREDRPPQLRTPRMDTFFSGLLLPHEVAHQWWGNIVTAADYRTGWLVEAMANYSALQFLEKTEGTATVNAALEGYRDDLIHEENGKTVESAGPVDFGQRLVDTAGTPAWHAIIYEKGTWVLHMLHQRLGDENFRKMEERMLQEYASKPISNEDFRKVASNFVPAEQPDGTLGLFFDTWVYGTGIPKMRLKTAGKNTELDLSGVDEDFTADVPLTCKSKEGRQQTRWVRVSNGSNTVEANGCELPSSHAFLYYPAP